MFPANIKNKFTLFFLQIKGPKIQRVDSLKIRSTKLWKAGSFLIECKKEENKTPFFGQNSAGTRCLQTIIEIISARITFILLWKLD